MSCTTAKTLNQAWSERSQGCINTTANRSASVRCSYSKETGITLGTLFAGILALIERKRRKISSTMQQTSAVVATRDFLLRLIDTKETPRIPREVRREARALLRHYPIASELRPVLEKGFASEDL